MEDDEKFDDYLERMRGDAEWGGNQELVAASRLFKVTAWLIHDRRGRAVLCRLVPYALRKRRSSWRTSRVFPRGSPHERAELIPIPMMVKVNSFWRHVEVQLSVPVSYLAVGTWGG